MEAISHASTALGILAKDGLVIAAEKKVASKLLDETTGGEKIYIINEYVSLSLSRFRDSNRGCFLLMNLPRKSNLLLAHCFQPT